VQEDRLLVDAHRAARITSWLMSTSRAEQPSASPAGSCPCLCLGEALVDLICEQPIEGLGEAGAFVPHFGGVVANVAIVAARAGARVALAGGAGGDDWGRWLSARLAREGVELRWFQLVDGRQTAVALVTVGDEGEPRYHLYGDTIPTVVHALGGRVEQAVDRCGALFISSNTLVTGEERDVTMRARELMLERERPVMFDPNLRLHRWPSRAQAAASCNACVPGALLVRATADEAAVMTGEEDPERAALALVKAGARLVVLTLGARGVILRGELRADVAGRSARVLSTVGAGDVLTGLLLARLALTGFYPPAVAAALPEAVEASARACERWGALD
jgi:sugar/nucleoside kinase (ribokinase family)